MLTALSRNSNGTYGPTEKNKLYYKPNPAHGIHSHYRRKSKWSIEENKELPVMTITESHKEDLYCYENDCYFSIVNNGKFAIGQKGERVAKFPKPSNESDPWHGYPVKCDTSFNTPSEPLLDKLVEHGIITDITRNRIERSIF